MKQTGICMKINKELRNFILCVAVSGIEPQIRNKDYSAAFNLRLRTPIEEKFCEI